MLEDKTLRKFKEAYKHITSDKSWVVTLLLCLFCGCFGLHRFYTHNNKTGIFQLVLSISLFGLPISIIWAIYDLFQILYNNFYDYNSKILDKNITKKSVFLLTFFFGYLGFCDFYIKDYKKGLVKFLLFISCIGSFISVIWNLIELTLICFSKIKVNKYSGLNDDLDTNKSVLLLIFAYVLFVVIFSFLCFGQSNISYLNVSSASVIISNAWTELVAFVKWILKLFCYLLCAILVIAFFSKSVKDDSKTIKVKNNVEEVKHTNEYAYAIISYQNEGQIYSFKAKQIRETSINKTIWITNTKGFNKQAKFSSINNISFEEYNSSNLPDYRLKKDFYKK